MALSTTTTTTKKNVDPVRLFELAGKNTACEQLGTCLGGQQWPRNNSWWEV
jgi:hypothetical protein